MLVTLNVTFQSATITSLTDHFAVTCEPLESDPVLDPPFRIPRWWDRKHQNTVVQKDIRASRETDVFLASVVYS